MKSYRWIGGTTPLIFNRLDLDEWSDPRSGRLISEKEPDVGWVDFKCCLDSFFLDREEFFAPTGIRIPHCPSRSVFTIPTRPGLTNLRHACPKWQAVRYPWHSAFTAVQFFYFFCPNSVSILSYIYIYIYIFIYIWQYIYLYIYIFIYIYIYTHNTCLTPHSLYMNYRCYQITLQWNIFTQIGAVRSADRIFIIGAPAWLWLGEYVTLGRTFYSLLLKQEAVAAPSYCNILWLIAFLKEVFIRNTIITLCFDYITLVCINSNNDYYRRFREVNLVFKFPWAR